MKLLFAIVFIVHIFYALGVEIPEKFLGTFKLDRSENLDSYLIAKDIGFFQRKIVAFLSVSKKFSKNMDGSYNFHTLTGKRNLLYDNVVLGKEFEGKILDGSKKTFKYIYNPVTEILEEHQIDKEKKVPEEVIFYTIENEILVWKSTYKGVTCKRYYNKV
uniref:Lipocln_cytosolic_FA-bd_dom domain-containing protein n=1 Tax=Strongyloides venezuelensis TaxID=75913 RepID=A0A0K0FNA2_STRVS